MVMPHHEPSQCNMDVVTSGAFGRAAWMAWKDSATATVGAVCRETDTIPSKADAETLGASYSTGNIPPVSDA